jgi:hypothetical protein
MTLGLLKKDIKLFVQCKYKKMRGYKEWKLLDNLGFFAHS